MAAPKVHMVGTTSVPECSVADDSGLRTISREDIPNLGKLMLAAYAGTVDYEGESEEEAVATIQSFFDGDFGEYLKFASVVIDHESDFLSASLVSLWHGRPLLVFSVTAPEHKGKGLAGRCITASIQALARAGYEELHLYVTPTNSAALATYKRLGFRVVSV